MKEKIRLWLWLGKTNLFISAFTFGGGYVVVPMVRKYFVHKKQLFSEDELMEMAAIAQSTPGAIAVNLVSLAGLRTGGAAGLLISCVCAVIPPLVILTVISLCYSAVISNVAVSAVLRGMQAGAAALIVDFVVDMAALILNKKSVMLDLLVAAAFLASFFTEIHLIFILLGSCLICALWVLVKRRGAAHG